MVFRIVLVGVIAQCWTPGFVVADGSATEKLWVKEYLKNKVTPASINSVSSYEGSNITSSDYNDDISSPEIPSDFSQKYFWPRISTTPKEPNSNEATEVQGVEITTKSKLEKTPTRNNSDSSYEESKITSSDYNDDISPPDIPSDFSQKYFWPRISTTPKEPNTDGTTEAQDVKSKTRSESKKGKRRKREADTTRRTKKPAARRRTRKPTNTTTKRRTRKPTNTTSKRRTRKSKATTTKSDVGSSTVSTKRYATRISFMGFPVIVGSIEEEQPTTMRKEIPSTTPRTEGPIKIITKIAFWGGIVEVPAEHATKKPVLLETASPAQKLSEVTELTTERKPTLDVTKLAFGMGFVPFARQTEEKTEAASDVLTTTTVVITARPRVSADHSTTTAKSNEESTTTAVRSQMTQRATTVRSSTSGPKVTQTVTDVEGSTSTTVISAVSSQMTQAATTIHTSTSRPRVTQTVTDAGGSTTVLTVTLKPAPDIRIPTVPKSMFERMDAEGLTIGPGFDARRELNLTKHAFKSPLVKKPRQRQPVVSEDTVPLKPPPTHWPSPTMPPGMYGQAPKQPKAEFSFDPRRLTDNIAATMSSDVWDYMKKEKRKTKYKSAPYFPHSKGQNVRRYRNATGFFVYLRQEAPTGLTRATKRTPLPLFQEAPTGLTKATKRTPLPLFQEFSGLDKLETWTPPPEEVQNISSVFHSQTDVYEEAFIAPNIRPWMEARRNLSVDSITNYYKRPYEETFKTPNIRPWMEARRNLSVDPVTNYYSRPKGADQGLSHFNTRYYKAKIQRYEDQEPPPMPEPVQMGGYNDRWIRERLQAARTYTPESIYKKTLQPHVEGFKQKRLWEPPIPGPAVESTVQHPATPPVISSKYHHPPPRPPPHQPPPPPQSSPYQQGLPFYGQPPGLPPGPPQGPPHLQFNQRPAYPLHFQQPPPPPFRPPPPPPPQSFQAPPPYISQAAYHPPPPRPPPPPPPPYYQQPPPIPPQYIHPPLPPPPLPPHYRQPPQYRSQSLPDQQNAPSFHKPQNQTKPVFDYQEQQLREKPNKFSFHEQYIPEPPQPPPIPPAQQIPPIYEQRRPLYQFRRKVPLYPFTTRHMKLPEPVYDGQTDYSLELIDQYEENVQGHQYDRYKGDLKNERFEERPVSLDAIDRKFKGAGFGSKSGRGKNFFYYEIPGPPTYPTYPSYQSMTYTDIYSDFLRSGFFRQNYTMDIFGPTLSYNFSRSYKDYMYPNFTNEYNSAYYKYKLRSYGFDHTQPPRLKDKIIRKFERKYNYTQDGPYRDRNYPKVEDMIVQKQEGDRRQMTNFDALIKLKQKFDKFQRGPAPRTRVFEYRRPTPTLFTTQKFVPLKQLTPKPRGMTAREAMRAAARQAAKEIELEEEEAEVDEYGDKIPRWERMRPRRRGFRRSKRSVQEIQAARAKLSNSIETKRPMGSRKYTSSSEDYGGNSRERRPPIGEPLRAHFQTRNKGLLEVLKPDVWHEDGIEDDAKEVHEYIPSLLSEKHNTVRLHGQSARVNIMPHKYQLTRGKGRPRTL